VPPEPFQLWPPARLNHSHIRAVHRGISPAAAEHRSKEAGGLRASAVHTASILQIVGEALDFYSYGHLSVTGYKWDYTFYKWGYKYL